MAIRVLIVDDSRTACAALRAAFAADPAFEVIDDAATGREAVAKAWASRPDLVTMDVFLPGSNGIEATAAIMSSAPTRVVIVTSARSEDPDLIYRAMQAGALEVWPKPPSPSHPAYAAEIGRFLRALKALACVPVVRRSIPSIRSDSGPAPVSRPEARPPLLAPNSPPPPSKSCDALLIGASTGGPPVIEEILRGLPRDFSLPIVIVQHITPGFIQGLAAWLFECTRHPVEVVTEPRPLKAGRIYLAGDGSHTVLVSRHAVGLSRTTTGGFHCPSVDVLFESAAENLGAGCIAVLLTGMGADGARGLLELKKAGAFTIAQALETCAVEGMPSTAIRLGAATCALPPHDIPKEVRKWLAETPPANGESAVPVEPGKPAVPDETLSTYEVVRKRFDGRRAKSPGEAENAGDEDDFSTYYETSKRKGGS